ncbi:MAG: multiubiquitin domain-containing protein [Bacteroidales bacterium]
MSYKIKINGRTLVFENKIVSGSDILEKAELLPIEKFDLFKKIEGREFEPIQYDEKVDLSEPGVERFRVLVKEELTFKVDDEPYSTNEIELSSVDILKMVGKSNETHYLKEIRGHMEITYKEDEYKLIVMIGHPVFLTCKKDPTTVS